MKKHCVIQEPFAAQKFSQVLILSTRLLIQFFAGLTDHLIFNLNVTLNCVDGDSYH